MKTIAVLSRKGGTGKTTIATHLCVAAEEAGEITALIDLDPQSSAARWSESRQDDTPATISTRPSRLREVLRVAEESGVTLAILDTAPHTVLDTGPQTETAAYAAARAASLVVIPCRPALIDLQAIDSTIAIIHLAKVPAQIVLNAVPARGDLAAQARRAVKIYDVPCAPCELGNRIGFVHAYNAGLTVQEFEPKSKATHEVRALYKYLTNEIGV